MPSAYWEKIEKLTPSRAGVAPRGWGTPGLTTRGIDCSAEALTALPTMGNLGNVERVLSVNHCLRIGFFR